MEFGVNFSSIKKSLETKPVDKKSNRLIKSKTLTSIKEPEANYRLFHDKIFESYRIPEINFTNCLPEEKLEVEPYIEKGIEEICESGIDLKAMKAIKISGKYKDRIEKVLTNYDIDDELKKSAEEGFLYKITTRDLLDRAGRLRIVVLYSKDIEKNVTNLDLVFIDFYHLFIPSEHNGNGWNKVSSKEYSKRKDFKKNIKDNPDLLCKLETKFNIKCH